MKNNALRITTWLYPPDDKVRWVATSELPLVAPSLTPGGLQSLLNYLKQKGIIGLERMAGSQLARLTPRGQRALGEKLPVFAAKRRQWQGEWQLICFLKTPASDKGFRILRRQLQTVGAAQLIRGVFLYPGELPDQLSIDLRNNYEGLVAVLKVTGWSFGDEASIIGSIFNFSDLYSTYSSISKEIDSLLIKHVSLNSLINQQKSRFSSVFDRLYENLRLDPGFQQGYFSQEKSGLDLLFLMQKLSQ